MAQESDCKIEVRPNTIITNAGQVLAVYGKLTSSNEDLVKMLRFIKYQSNNRLSRQNESDKNRLTFNERSSDISFGFKPKRPVFGLNAGPLVFNKTYPKYYERLSEFGREMESHYSRHSKVAYERHLALAGEIGAQYRIPGTVFTQGIINNSNPLSYHYDRGNFKNVSSAMAVFTDKIEGGNLNIPSLNAKILIESDTYFLFDGQSLVHGVTPIIKKAPGAYRYSIVYYALALQKNAGDAASEIEKARAMDFTKHLRKIQK